MSRTFVDVGVIRIGEYLTRVSELKSIRGASWMVSDATREQEIIKTLESAGISGVQRNPDVGEADGVVHLEVAGTDPQEVAERVLRSLRRDLPAADLIGLWATAEDYATAFPLMVDQRTTGTGLEWVPVVAECPWLNPCTKCGRRPAQRSGPDASCPDCAKRDRRGSAAAAALRRNLGEGLALPGGDLKSLLPTVRTHTPADNHIAMVTADGNGVGALFDSLIANPQVSAAERRVVSLGLAQAAREALIDAASAIRAGGVAPVIPVLVGGDDLCVYVAAAQGWAFTQMLLSQFEVRAYEMLAAAIPGLPADELPRVSMSAGLLFMPVKHPASEAFVISDALMRRAKRSTAGRTATVSWLDITTDGIGPGDPAAGRPSAQVSDLVNLADQLRALATISPSARKGLEKAMAELRSVQIAEDEVNRYVHKQGDRLGVEQLVSPFVDAGVAIDLGTALDLVRWFK
ncbi:MAG: hypothetical protein WCF36_21075 [Candidatus Nanopelagicales bacterium]